MEQITRGLYITDQLGPFPFGGLVTGSVELNPMQL